MNDEVAQSSILTSRQAINAITKPFRARISLFALSTFGVGLLEAIFLVVVTRAALAITRGEETIVLTRNVAASVVTTALIGLAILVLRLALALVTIRIQTGLTYRITSQYRKSLGRAYLSASWSTQARQPLGFLQQVVVQFPNHIASLVGYLVSLISSGLALTALLGLALVINAASTGIVVATLALLSLALTPIARRIRERSTKLLQSQVHFANHVAEIGDQCLEISSFGVGDTVRTNLDELIDSEAESSHKVALLGSMIPPSYTTLAYGAVLLALLALSWVGGQDLTEIGAVMLIMMRSLSYGQLLQSSVSALAQFTPYAETILKTSRDLEASRDLSGNASASHFSKVEFDRVHFTYSGTRHGLLDASFTLAAGETIGVVGPSGSGKTTLVQLLLGLLRPSSGQIRIDGTSLNSLDRAAWNRLACYVPQEPKLVTGTIAENVRFFRDGISDEMVLQALSSTNFTLDSARFPNGINTQLGGSGRQLSGGQRQRLAVARALATHPSLLILDEPTSALDVESEEIIAETLRRLKGSVLTVVVSHRESTLEICDRRLVVDHGTVREEL